MSNADATTNRANLWPLAPSVVVGLSCESVIPHKSSDTQNKKLVKDPLIQICIGRMESDLLNVSESFSHIAFRPSEAHLLKGAENVWLLEVYLLYDAELQVHTFIKGTT